ncbi:DUF6584 family protein [Kitasatospora sp. NPDC088134]|uniref:DUF6584 family protein n=1 Tax=Kitasatospora sp. NPDC088134 TaxID=3364071 RepID=UPI0038305BE2
MSVKSTLARAAAEHRDGWVLPARRRLHGLLSNDPTDLAVRHALALAYDQAVSDGWPPPGGEGRRWWEQHLSEVGRWNYLDESLTAEELTAFTHRFRTPARQLAVLRWPDPAGNPPGTALARRRLAALHHRATGTAPDWPEHPEDAATTVFPGPDLIARPQPAVRRSTPPVPPPVPSRPEHRPAYRALMLALVGLGPLVLALLVLALLF